MSSVVYTDGACIPNPGPGGWAWAARGGAYASGADPSSTNQRMELMAVLRAVEANPGPVRIVSDSNYVVNCFRARWYDGWERRSWKGAGGKPVANQDLWRPLLEQFHQREDEVSFEWVKGHSDDEMNDVVDRLANEAARTQTGRSGPEPPTVLGAPDVPGLRPTRAADMRLSSIPGWRTVAFGLGPPALGGYDPTNPITERVRRKLAEILAGLRTVHPDLIVLTGLGLGAAQLAADAATAVNVPYVAVLAYPDPQRMWPVRTQVRYRELIARATSTLTLSAENPKSKQAAGMAAGHRDRALSAAAHGALVVWDGHDRTIREHVAALERRIPDDVWIIPPQ